MSRRPCFIAIAGPSGSGKTTLALHLQKQLDGSCSLLSLDSYYHELRHLSLEERARCNFDHPDAFDWDLLLTHLRCLSDGEAVEQPVYDFATHTRAKETIPIASSSYIIVEGILTLHRAEIRSMMDLKVYVDAPDAECFDRRLLRDMEERGRTRESVNCHYTETVRPMAELYVWPSRVFADLIVSGTDSLRQSCEAVLALLSHRARAAKA